MVSEKYNVKKQQLLKKVLEINNTIKKEISDESKLKK